MTRVFSQADTPFSRADTVAVAINKDRSHLGLFHSASQKRVSQLHLASHNDLRSGPISKVEFLIWVKPAISSEVAFCVAAFCRLFSKIQATGQVPYGFSSPKGALTRTGHLEDGVVGLTCASLALALFERSDAPLLDYATWPLREADAEWQQLVADRYLQPRLSKEDLQRVVSQIPSARFTPLEVAAAASSESLPQDYAGTQALIPIFNDLAARCV